MARAAPVASTAILAQDGSSAAKRARLKEIIRERSFSEGPMTALASGRQSSFYFNMKRTMSQPEALSLVADLVLELIPDQGCDYIGGLEMGAVPILNAVSLRSFENGAPIPLIWIRKKPKEHGSRDLIEGEPAEALAGKRVIMIEDVTTTGGSVLRAIQIAREAGALVDTVVTLVDRQEGAAENLRPEGISLRAVYKAEDFRASACRSAQASGCG